NTLKEHSEIDWSYLSPSAEFAPGKRTGEFKIGQDELIVTEDVSRISAEDFAVALVDELENGQHLQQRFTVGY
ncbi:MAG: NAD(P)-dependent oxidoreductase, partial [Acinetobacter sp.]